VNKIIPTIKAIIPTTMHSIFTTNNVLLRWVWS